MEITEDKVREIARDEIKKAELEKTKRLEIRAQIIRNNSELFRQSRDENNDRSQR